MSLRLIQQLSIPQIDYSKLIVYTSNAPYPSTIKRVYPNTPFEIVNPLQDIGALARNNAIEVNGALVYVNDYMHSHDSDTEDTTTYSTSSTTETALLTIDYGRVITAKEVVIKLGCWVSTTAGYWRVYVSQDGSTWTLIGSFSLSNVATESYFYARAFNVSFRYIRFTAYVVTSGYNAYMRVRKIFIIT
jgi:hypothetical protein